MGGVWIVGVGPGGPRYLTIKAIRLIEEADYVVGFKQVLRAVEGIAKDKILTIDFINEKEVLRFLASGEKAGKKYVICCCGDPNFSDKELVQKVKSMCANVEMVPGISSVQISCAKAGLAIEDSVFITFHKGGSIHDEKEELLKVVKEGCRNAIVLPRPWDFMPKDIAKFLLDRGVPKDLEVVVHQNLTLEDEKVHVYKLSNLLNAEHSDLSIVILRARA